MPSILQIKSLSKSFGGLKAVYRCGFEVEKGSVTALIGPNGAGKTTIFDLISGLLKPDGGNIIFGDEDITRFPIHKRAKRGIGRTFQSVRLFPELTALENITVALPHHPDSFLDIFRPHKNKLKLLKEKAVEYLKLVNLDDKAHNPAGSLSYGQQKLLEIIRAVALDADLLLLDEPAAGVNRTMLHNIISLIKTLQKQGKTILLVEHDIGFVMNLCEKIIVLDHGQEIAEGSPEKIQKDPKVLEAYLGTHHKKS